MNRIRNKYYLKLHIECKEQSKDPTCFLYLSIFLLRPLKASRSLKVSKPKNLSFVKRFEVTSALKSLLRTRYTAWTQVTPKAIR